jgi:hypothetical protein
MYACLNFCMFMVSACMYWIDHGPAVDGRLLQEFAEFLHSPDIRSQLNLISPKPFCSAVEILQVALNFICSNFNFVILRFFEYILPCMY